MVFRKDRDFDKPGKSIRGGVLLGVRPVLLANSINLQNTLFDCLEDIDVLCVKIADPTNPIFAV